MTRHAAAAPGHTAGASGMPSRAGLPRASGTPAPARRHQRRRGQQQASLHRSFRHDFSFISSVPVQTRAIVFCPRFLSRQRPRTRDRPAVPAPPYHLHSLWQLRRL